MVSVLTTLRPYFRIPIGSKCLTIATTARSDGERSEPWEKLSPWWFTPKETAAFGSFRHGRRSLMTQQTTTHARHGDERQSGNALDEEALQNALDDPDSQPLTPELRSRLRRVPNPKAIRLAMGLSQEAFARRMA